MLCMRSRLYATIQGQRSLNICVSLREIKNNVYIRPRLHMRDGTRDFYVDEWRRRQYAIRIVMCVVLSVITHVSPERLKLRQTVYAHGELHVGAPRQLPSPKP